MSSNQIFQQKALDKLNRPNKGGNIFSITTPTGWIALAAVGISLFSILVWAFFGIMAEQVTGYGILVDDSGVANISPISSGRIVEMRLRPGDEVAEGDVVALVEQSDLEQQIYMTAEQARTSNSVEDMRAHTAQLASAKEQHHYKAQVVSPYNGTINSQRFREGDMVAAGTPIYDVDIKVSDDISGIIFVSALTGHKIKPGMTIQVAPGAIDSSLYGSLVGTVREVSQYPVTSDRITYWTGNKEFAQMILQKCGGSVMEVKVELTRDEDTKTGYLWTTLAGPQEEIHEGMACTANAIVDRKSPVAYAFDKMGQWLRTD